MFIRMFVVVLLVFPIIANADIIIFKDGKKVKVKQAWEEGNMIKCERFGGIIGYPKSEVEGIEKEQSELDKDMEKLELEENDTPNNYKITPRYRVFKDLNKYYEGKKEISDEKKKSRITALMNYYEKVRSLPATASELQKQGFSCSPGMTANFILKAQKDHYPFYDQVWSDYEKLCRDRTEEYNRRMDSLRKAKSSEPPDLIGVTYIAPKSLEIINRYGFPETLAGTDNFKWVAYFPKGDFTIITDKKTNIIKNVLSGRKPQ